MVEANAVVERVTLATQNDDAVEVRLDGKPVGLVAQMDRQGWAFIAHTVTYALRPTREEAEKAARELVGAWAENMIVWTDTTKPVSPNLPAGTLPHFSARGSSLSGRSYTIGIVDRQVGLRTRRKVMHLSCVHLVTNQPVALPSHGFPGGALAPTRDQEFAFHKRRAETFEGFYRSGLFPVKVAPFEGEEIAAE